MKLSAFQEGLRILAPHYKGGDGYHIGAEHDVFYVYKTDTPLDEAEVARMLELGWFQEDVEYEGDMKVTDYDPEESWTAYV